jgi:NTE family protein
MMIKFLSFLAFSLVGNIARTQPITNLVFEGAGIRGIAYCGAISQLEKKGMMRSIKRVGGTSAGAITALALSIGYTGKELEEITASTNYKKFNDGRFTVAGGINRVNKYFGWYRSREFDEWLGKFIGKKTGNANITFEELHARNNQYLDLYVTGTSLNLQKTIVFSHEHYPKMKIRDAVRISMSIPLYFEAVFMDEQGNTFYHPKDKKGLQVMVDGGFIANFPVWLFDSSKYRHNMGVANHFLANNETLGFRIDRQEQIELDRQGIQGLAPLPVGDIKQYMEAFMLLMMESMNRPQLLPADRLRTVSISDGKLGARIRKLKPEEIKRLIDNGKKAVEEFALNGKQLGNP